MTRACTSILPRKPFKGVGCDVTLLNNSNKADDLSVCGVVFLETLDRKGLKNKAGLSVWHQLTLLQPSSVCVWKLLITIAIHFKLHCFELNIQASGRVTVLRWRSTSSPFGGIIKEPQT